ncbi:glycosyltransferase [Mesorhizobium huakuii]|uniref:glycosyltransferase n=1 Tax=Mesorhizobium huakuii TaxID=28104 RepID=UPI001FD3EC85|nr:glycosyltransferase [Mesorhizobium huakuii]
MSTIGLCMIVKNETKVILQCLASVLPLVDYVLIVDTGSEDGTQDLIRGFLADHNVQGAVIDEPWRDFAYNRTFALERLRKVETVDYAMIIDADDVLIRDADFDPIRFKSQMEHDLYDVEVLHGGISFYRPQICRNCLPFAFKGVLHEYLEAPPGHLTRETAKGFRVATGRGGARSQNPRKYQDDSAVLENALATETDPFLVSRYTFYLAQSYKDSGEREKSLANYLKRAELGFWDEEVYVSLLEAGNLMAALGRPFEEVVAAFERAAQVVPRPRGGSTRREPLLPQPGPECRRNGICASRARPCSTRRTFHSALGLRLRSARRVCHQCLLGRRLPGIARRLSKIARLRQIACGNGEACGGQRALRHRQASGQ